MGRTVIVAQARMSSTRLPGKTLADLGGRPMIDLVVERARRATLADEVVIATTNDATDDVLAAHLELLGVPYVRGSLDDVLSRYELAARTFHAETIVRITCDCPFINPSVIDDVIAAYRAAPEVDYCGNTLVRTYPIGMDTEVFSREALERAAAEASQPGEREHVTPYLYQHPDLFRLRNVEAPSEACWPELRLTVDEPEDLALMRALLAHEGPEASLHAVIGFLRLHPELAAMNADVVHRHTEKPTDW